MPTIKLYTQGTDLVVEHDDSPANAALADHVNKTLRAGIEARKGTSVTMAKARLGDAVLTLRKTEQEKAELLDRQAADWEQKAQDGTYTLATEVRDYMRDKAKTARQEAARLRGEAVPEPEKAAKPVTVTLPR